MRIIPRVLFLASLFLCQLSVAQEALLLEGTIVDSESQEPLKRATILYRANSLGFTSNEKGEFRFQLVAPKTDSIEVRYMGYKPLTLAIKDFLEKKDKTIELVTDQISLEVVVLEGEKPDVDVNKLMRQVSREYNRNKPEKTHIATAFFRETGSYDGKYVFFNESTGYSLYLGNRSDAALFSNYKFFPEQSRISNIPPDFQEVISSMDSDRRYLNKRFVGFSNNENNYRRFQEYGPLSRKNRRSFDYDLRSSYVDDNGIQFLEINFSNESMQGYLTINSHNLHVIDAVYTTDGLISNPFKTRTTGKVNLVFSYIDDVPFISELTSESTYEGLTITNHLKIRSQKFEGFDITEDQYWGFNNAAIHPYITYHPQDWMDLPYYQSEEFEKVSSDLSKNGLTLEEQFMENSDTWLTTPTSGIQQASAKIEELKVYFE